MREAFSLGSLVVPAVDSNLQALGYDVASLGMRGLGVVIEGRKSKSLVSFPELNITLWLSHDEMADVEQEASLGEKSFQNIMVMATELKSQEAVFWIWKLCQMLPVKFVLGIETGDLIEIWDQEDQPLETYYKGDFNVPATYVGFGVTEFFPKQWREVEALFGNRLLFSRFLPSGMHKLEIALYVRKF